jgi:hypothetical protein
MSTMWIGSNREKFQIHLELDRKTYWNVVQDAADQEQHPEEFLEAYINTAWGPTESETL